MRFEVLGPMLVWDGHSPRPVGGRRQRRLLAALLLQAGKAVPATHLSSAMWSGEPPVTANAQLHNAVAALRRALRADEHGPQIVREGSGFALKLMDASLDLAEFDHLVAKAARVADAGAAAQILREALCLWRGAALDGVNDADDGGGVLAAQARLLDGRRLDCLEQCLALDLEQGRHAEIVGELAALSAEHPLRERLVALRMLALHRAGRRSEALAVFAEARRLLVDRTGLDPGGELELLHRAILRADPALTHPTLQAGVHLKEQEPDASPASTPAEHLAARRPLAQLPMDVHGFTGRAVELARLDAVLTAADEQPTSVVIAALWGTAGVGKSALAVHWAHRVAENFPDGQLYLNMRGFDSGGMIMTASEAIRCLLDAMGTPAPTIPPDSAAQAALYRGLLAGKRVLVVLDNVRDVQQVRPVLPGAPGCMVVVTSRNQLPGLVAGQGAQPIAVDLLTAADARALLTRRLGSAAADAAVIDELAMVCARLPLALTIVAARAATNPSRSLRQLADQLRAARGLAEFAGDDAGHDAATDLRAVFACSYEILTDPAARLFRLLGLHPGADVSAHAAASLAGVPVERASTLIAELSGANLVVQRTAGRCDFHDLLHAYAGDLTAAHDRDEQRRAALHRMLDHYLHTAYAADRLLFPARDPIALPAPQPGVCVPRLTNRDEALAWFIAEHRVLLAVVDGAGRTGFDSHAWQLAWAMVIFFDLQGHGHDWVSTQHAALAAARRLGDGAAQALTLRGLARACMRMGQFNEAEAHLRGALELCIDLGDVTGQAHIHLNLGRRLGEQSQYGQALDHASRALDLFRVADHRPGQASALNGLGWFHAQLGDYAEALRHCEQARSLHHELGDLVGEAATWDSIAYAHHHLGNQRQAIDCYHRSLELLRGIGDRYNEADTLGRLGDTLGAAGDAETARAVRLQALTILDELGRTDSDALREALQRHLGTRRS